MMSDACSAVSRARARCLPLQPCAQVGHVPTGVSWFGRLGERLVGATAEHAPRCPAPLPQPGARQPRGGQNVPALTPVQVSCNCCMSGGGRVAAAVSAVACLVGARRRPLRQWPLGWRHGLSTIAGVPAVRKPILPANLFSPHFTALPHYLPVASSWARPT